jgi:hypothetical protein
MVRLEPTTDKMSAMSKDKKAFALPTEARAALAGSLLDSLDDERDDNAEAEWEVEITRRLQEFANRHGSNGSLARSATLAHC